MSAKMSQKDYLKKYLSNDKKKKKRKDKSIGKTNVKIIDDDIDISRIQNITEDDADLFQLGEEAPQIVGVIDDRPPELRAKEDFTNNSKWKVLNADDDYENGKDISPPRKAGGSSKTYDRDLSPPRKSSSSNKSKYKEDRSRKRSPDKSPARIKREKLTPDLSPRRNRTPDLSPKRNRKRTPDLSPARVKRERRTPDLSPKRSRNNKTPDMSPPRSRKRSPSVRQIKKERNETPDLSPRMNKTPDLSPPRHGRKASRSPQRKKSSRWGNSPDRRRDRSPGRRENTPSKMTKTLDGKMAGLQNAKALRVENEKFKERENEMFDKMSTEVSGRYAETVVRERGRKKDIEKEIREEIAKKKKDEKKKEVYSRWGKGVKQVEEYKQQLESDYHEMNKPLARYSDDADLDDHLKQQERIGDPMLQYLRSKKKEQNKRAGISEKPKYQGMFPNNRYNIRPGYRWDGVDRSNGYEKKWFEMQSNKKAVAEEAYKYSVEDM